MTTPMTATETYNTSAIPENTDNTDEVSTITFADLGLSKSRVAFLEEQGFVSPTPIQPWRFLN